MKYFMLFAWTISCVAYDDFGKEWIEQWQQIKSNLQSGEFMYCTKFDTYENVCSLYNTHVASQQYSPHRSEISVSLFDGKVSSSNVLGFLTIIFDLLRVAKAAREFKDMVYAMTYDEFLTNFPEFIALEYQILRLQKLIHTSCCATFPEQILARIYLVQTSLCDPYAKVLNKCTKNLYKSSFDEQGKFIWNNTLTKDLFKNFYKKVPQDWKQILLQAKKLPKEINISYLNEYANFVDNHYNQTLIDMVYEGIAQNFPRLKNLCRNYFDKLVQRLYDYYIEQRFAKQKTQYQQYDPFFVDDQNEADEEECVLRDYYYQELVEWLCVDESLLAEYNILYEVVGCGDDLLELPFDEQYQYTLLQRFVDKICHGNKTEQEIQKLFFTESGILKKYNDDSFVCKYFKTIELDDELLHKAVNFALAIKDKDQNCITQKVAKLLLNYVVLAYDQEENFLLYKKKVENLFNALLQNQYDETIFQI